MTHRLFVPALALLAWTTALSPSVAADQKFEVKSVAEKKISQLPAGPLFWRIEMFNESGALTRWRHQNSDYSIL